MDVPDCPNTPTQIHKLKSSERRNPQLRKCLHKIGLQTLLVIARNWKQPSCSSAEECIKEMWFICTMEYYSAIKDKDIMNFAGKMDGTRKYHPEWGNLDPKGQSWQHNCPLRGPTQYLMEINAKSLRETLHRAQGILWKSWAKDWETLRG